MKTKDIDPTPTPPTYTSAWNDFTRWCREHDQQALPASAETAMRYLLDRRDLAETTLRTRVAAIRHFHAEAGEPSPTGTATFRSFWRNFRDESMRDLLDVFTPRLTLENRLTDQARQLIPKRAEDLNTYRDRALLLLIVAGDLGRTDVVKLNVEDLNFDDAADPHRVEVALDVVEPGATLELERQDDPRYDPVRALADWTRIGGIEEGPLFRGLKSGGRSLRRGRMSGRAVTNVVKQAAEEADIDPSSVSVNTLRRPALE